MTNLITEVNYINLIERGYTITITDVSEVFELIYQLKEYMHYPTRAKVIFQVEQLSNNNLLKFEGKTVKETIWLIDELEKILYILVKR